MYDYQQLALKLLPITEQDLILFKVSAEEKNHIVKQYNRALINAQGDGTDVAEIFLKPLISQYPTWGDAALVFGLCLARENEFKRASESIEYAINNVLSTETNLNIAQEALRRIREDIKNPQLKPQTVQTSILKTKGSPVSETGEPSERQSFQAPILIKASKSPTKARMATDRERREVMMRASQSSNGELPNDDINVDIPRTPADNARIVVKVVSGIIIVAIIVLAVVYGLIPLIVRIKLANENQDKIDYLTSEMSENVSDPTVASILADYASKYASEDISIEDIATEGSTSDITSATTTVAETTETTETTVGDSTTTTTTAATTTTVAE